jgi:hypothetical protein
MRQLPTWRSQAPTNIKGIAETPQGRKRQLEILLNTPGGLKKESLATIGVSYPLYKGWQEDFIRGSNEVTISAQKLDNANFEYIMRLLMNNNVSGSMTSAMDLIYEDYKSRNPVRTFWAEYLEALL